MFKNFFKNLLNYPNEKDMIYEYLSSSTDHVDLENRIKNIDRGLAPWQIRANQSLRGWL
jgi:predicted site-specific integrase-resolvase